MENDDSHELKSATSEQSEDRSQSTTSGNGLRVKRLFKNCEVSGCTKFSRGSTMRCVAHGGGKRCTVRNCARAARGREGVCIGHGGGKRCAQPNCSKSAIDRSDLCIAHGGGRQCRINGCLKVAQVTGGLCITHGGGKRCQHKGCPKSAMRGNNNFCRTHKADNVCQFLFCCNPPQHHGYCSVHWVGKKVDGSHGSTKSRRSSTSSNSNVFLNSSPGRELCVQPRNVNTNGSGDSVWSSDGRVSHLQAQRPCANGSRDFEIFFNDHKMNQADCTAGIGVASMVQSAAFSDSWVSKQLPQAFLNLCNSALIINEPMNTKNIQSIQDGMNMSVPGSGMVVKLTDFPDDPIAACSKNSGSDLSCSGADLPIVKGESSCMVSTQEVLQVNNMSLQYSSETCPSSAYDLSTNTIGQIAMPEAYPVDTDGRSTTRCSQLDQVAASSLFRDMILQGEQCQDADYLRSASCGDQPRVSTMYDPPLPVRRVQSAQAESHTNFLSRRIQMSDGAKEGSTLEELPIACSANLSELSSRWVTTPGDMLLPSEATNGIAGDGSELLRDVSEGNSITELAKELEVPEMQQAFMQELELSGW
mmetsp:Transcript_41304/g.78976  ORF Transcript_41304/g.78976 Transcript_41304/m.78976 type:complete len:587 (-) Transcript_41304:209-1969(-)